MNLISLNCRGLRSPSTVSQLKESMRLNVLDLIFLCKTKQSSAFVEPVTRKLKFGKRWIISDPVGRRRGLLVAWNQSVEVLEFRKNIFSIELMVKQGNEGDII